MDFCHATSLNSPTSEFYSVVPGHDSHGLDSIKRLDRCEIILSNQEDSEYVWKNIRTFDNYFKCARVQGTNNFDILVVFIILNNYQI